MKIKEIRLKFVSEEGLVGGRGGGGGELGMGSVFPCSQQNFPCSLKVFFSFSILVIPFP